MRDAMQRKNFRKRLVAVKYEEYRYMLSSLKTLNYKQNFCIFVLMANSVALAFIIYKMTH